MDVEANDVMEWILKNGADRAENKYVYILSPLLRAMEKGYVVEVQEINTCSDPGVIVAMNELLERGQVCLDSGRRITRDPESIAIFTMNVDYVGCNRLNASFMSRLHYKVVKNTPDPLEMRARLISELAGRIEVEGELAYRMAKAVAEMSQYCREQGIMDGSCGYREYKNWYTVASLLEISPRDAAFSTVLPSAAVDTETQGVIATAVLDKYFS